MSPASSEKTLAPCRSSPNCVSSEAGDKRHHVAPFRLARAEPGVWSEIRAAVLTLPRTRIVEEDETSLHAGCRSALFRFVDDLELQLRPAEGLVAVRSAARLGYYDLGVNRRRVEKLRRILQDRGLSTTA